jgi:hypothetical protein
LEFDSRVLGDLVLPLIVWYMFSIIYFFIYLIYQGRWPWYILVKMIPKKRSSWVSVPWMFQYIVNSYPPFGNHAKMGIDNLCLHPFTLLFVEVPVRTNDHHSIVVQIGFFFGLGTLIKYEHILSIYICISINAADRGSLEMDSRVLGDLVLPLIVWYIFSIVYFFIYLIYQGRWPWYILMKMIPKERSSWVSVPWMFQYIVNSYPPFGNHAKMGIDN